MEAFAELSHTVRDALVDWSHTARLILIVAVITTAIVVLHRLT